MLLAGSLRLGRMHVPTRIDHMIGRRRVNKWPPDMTLNVQLVMQMHELALLSLLCVGLHLYKI